MKTEFDNLDVILNESINSNYTIEEEKEMMEDLKKMFDMNMSIDEYLKWRY